MRDEPTHWTLGLLTTSADKFAAVVPWLVATAAYLVLAAVDLGAVAVLGAGALMPSHAGSTEG